jgi:riboflavin biosynthesis pyrimidine reductase
MPERPYTLLSCGMSIDGYIDTATDERLVLSNDADLDRVDAVRARRRGAHSASPAACRQPRSR